jgi:hypothetical protein
MHDEKLYKKHRRQSGKCVVCGKDLALSKDELLKKLGLEEATEITEEEVKTAYKNQARTHHPDKGGDPEKFQEINDAKEELLEILEEEGPLSIKPLQEVMEEEVPTFTPQELHNLRQVVRQMQAKKGPLDPCPVCKKI